MRIAEPHDYGIRDGVAQLLVFQVGGESRSGTLPNWRWVVLPHGLEIRPSRRDVSRRTQGPFGEAQPMAAALLTRRTECPEMTPSARDVSPIFRRRHSGEKSGESKWTCGDYDPPCPLALIYVRRPPVAPVESRSERRIRGLHSGRAREHARSFPAFRERDFRRGLRAWRSVAG